MDTNETTQEIPEENRETPLDFEKILKFLEIVIMRQIREDREQNERQ
jgi:hypothetical protein